MTYKYYCVHRPPMPGAIPNRGIIEIKDNDRRERMEGSPCDVWGYVVYDRELTEKEISDYELLKA